MHDIIINFKSTNSVIKSNMKNILLALTISILIIFSGCSNKQDKKAVSTTDISQPKTLKNLETKR